MKRYWVIGGVYADTHFEKLAEGHQLEKLGPYDDYATAKAVWQKRAWETVDQANARFSISEEGGDLCYWIVGGPYVDTHFNEPAAGGGEEWHGPFQNYEDAKKEWARLSWTHVDDALCRYRIEKLSAGAHPHSGDKPGGHNKSQ